VKERYQTLELETPAPDILLVRLNRPEVRNALNTQTGHDLTHVFVELAANPGSYRSVILTGSGDRAFCSGADLKERRGMSDDVWQRQHLVFERMMQAILDCPLPVIAAVNGAAYAGGCELVLCADFAYAVPEACFALTEVKIGIMPGGGATALLPRTTGLRRASEIILTAKPFGAEDALAWGVVNRLCAAPDLLPSVIETARAIGENAPLSVRQAKSSLRHGVNVDLRSAMLFEIAAYNRLVNTEDRREGINAFNEHRKPRFTGA
jgi:enoyl-CoA hydratase/carnithine racemase